MSWLSRRLLPGQRPDGDERRGKASGLALAEAAAGCEGRAVHAQPGGGRRRMRGAGKDPGGTHGPGAPRLASPPRPAELPLTPPPAALCHLQRRRCGHEWRPRPASGGAGRRWSPAVIGSLRGWSPGTEGQVLLEVAASNLVTVTPRTLAELEPTTAAFLHVHIRETRRRCTASSTVTSGHVRGAHRHPRRRSSTGPRHPGDAHAGGCSTSSRPRTWPRSCLVPGVGQDGPSDCSSSCATVSTFRAGGVVSTRRRVIRGGTFGKPSPGSATAPTRSGCAARGRAVDQRRSSCEGAQGARR